MVKIVRDVQLLIDAIDFCIPCKECPSATDENPCELFSGIRFPLDEFFPPVKKNNFAFHSMEFVQFYTCNFGLIFLILIVIYFYTFL
ncbi:MAG: hypothetical protein RSA27_03585 [Oscillospiraceae bacterium]